MTQREGQVGNTAHFGGNHYEGGEKPGIVDRRKQKRAKKVR